MPSEPTSHYEFDQRKYPDHPHWNYPATLLGDDHHGLWLHVPAGTIARRGEEPPRVVESGFVTLVPDDGCWIAEFYATHREYELYVNIGTRPRVSGTRISQVDLDLDVVRTVEGAVEILDEDEFAENRALYGYPPELTQLALAITDAVTAMVRDHQDPFDGAADRWLASVDPITLR